MGSIEIKYDSDYYHYPEIGSIYVDRDNKEIEILTPFNLSTRKVVYYRYISKKYHNFYVCRTTYKDFFRAFTSSKKYQLEKDNHEWLK